ncbi:hypothetical protein Tco_1308433 [Tanacetum coccineum]
MHRVQVRLVMGELRTELGMPIPVKQGRLSATIAMENGVALDEEQLLFLVGGQDNADEDVDEQPVQDLALNVDNVFQADDCDAFDSDVDEAPIAQTMFMENLSSADHVCDEVLTVSRFTKMHDAHTVVQARCLELEIELSKLHDKVQKDDHAKLVKRFSNLEVNHFNLQLKYQNLKECFGNNTSPSARDAHDCDSVFIIEKMKASIQGKDNTIKKLRMQLSQVQETRCDADHTLAFRALDSQITQLTRKVTIL